MVENLNRLKNLAAFYFEINNCNTIEQMLRCYDLLISDNYDRYDVISRIQYFKESIHNSEQKDLLNLLLITYENTFGDFHNIKSDAAYLSLNNDIKTIVDSITGENSRLFKLLCINS